MCNDNLSIAFNFESKFNFKWNFNSRLTKIFNVEYRKVSRGHADGVESEFPCARGVGWPKLAEESGAGWENVRTNLRTPYTRTIRTVASGDT